jgi:hypothetical protein
VLACLSFITPWTIVCVVYVLPSLINRFGKRFSIAELIASGYVSLSSNGARPDGIINTVSLFQPNSCSSSLSMIAFHRSFHVIVMGSGIPRFHPSAGGFTSGIRTSYGSFSIPEDGRKNFEIAHPQDSDEEEETHRYRSRSRHSGKSTLFVVESESEKTLIEQFTNQSIEQHHERKRQIRKIGHWRFR